MTGHDVSSEENRQQKVTRTVIKKRAALGKLAVAAVSLTLGLLIYWLNAPAVDIVARELGGRQQDLPAPPGTVEALWWDFIFILGYGIALLSVTSVAGQVFWTERGKRFAGFGWRAGVTAVAADVVENALLIAGLQMEPDQALTPWVLDVAAAAATVKFSALVPATIVAVFGTVTTVKRSIPDRNAAAKAHLKQADVRSPRPLDELSDSPSESAEASGAVANDVAVAEARWRRAYEVPDWPPEKKSRLDVLTGFCLSGGGIRSASVALGALQPLRDELRNADYLVSVSGGGYTAGALTQALTGAGDHNHRGVVHDAKNAYAEGSAELDRLRRNSSYLATTPTQMLVALGVLARGLLASLTVLFAPAVVLGVVIAWLYHFVPLARLPVLPGGEADVENAAGVQPNTEPTEAFTVLPSAVIAIGALGALALAAWLLHIWACSMRGTTPATPSRRSPRRTPPSSSADSRLKPSKVTYRLSVFLTQLTVLVSAFALGVPLIVWLAGRISVWIDISAGAVLSGSVGAVVLTYLSSLAAVLWRKRKTIKERLVGPSKKRTATAALPTGLVQLLLVIITVAVLVVAWLMLFGVSALATASQLTDSLSPSTLLIAVVLAVAAIAIGGLFDESSLSLHPFYRRRLASAFAARVVTQETPPAPRPADDHKPSRSEPSRRMPNVDTVAIPYEPEERTTLSDYGKVADQAQPFPQVIFAAAASLTGEGRTPPGLNAVSYTMSSDWIGGPDVGWVRTSHVEHISSTRLQRDLTVQAAVAISGAAFASAMGRFARWYQILLAVSGARLGSWLPNPAFIGRLQRARHHRAEPDWTVPPLPRIRRLPYLLREIFNVHRFDDRLLQVTDGGHYENLGLVELLRRRCRMIYCIDAAGDTPPTAKGLAYAIALAEAELGVKVTLDQPLQAEPGSGAKLKPEDPLATLNAALVADPVITGTITYPEAAGLGPCKADRTGTIVVARALLWPELPYQLLSYAAQNGVFPHDSTGDQWFNDDQFTAYTHLGRELGTKVKDAKLPERQWTGAWARIARASLRRVLNTTTNRR